MSEQILKYEIGDGEDAKMVSFPHTIKLKYPIKDSVDSMLEEITFKDAPCWEDLKFIKASAKGMTMDMHIPIVSELTDVPITSLNKIKSPDAILIMGFISPFLG